MLARRCSARGCSWLVAARGRSWHPRQRSWCGKGGNKGGLRRASISESSRLESARARHARGMGLRRRRRTDDDRRGGPCCTTRVVHRPQPVHTRVEAITREIASLDGPINDRAIKGVIGNMNTRTPTHAMQDPAALVCSKIFEAASPRRQQGGICHPPAAARDPRDALCATLPCAHLCTSAWALQRLHGAAKKC